MRPKLIILTWKLILRQLVATGPLHDYKLIFTSRLLYFTLALYLFPVLYSDICLLYFTLPLHLFSDLFSDIFRTLHVEISLCQHKH